MSISGNKRSVIGIVAAILAVIGLPVLVSAGSSGNSPTVCIAGGFWETGQNQDWDAGSKGWNQVRQVSTAQGSWQVRSVWAKNSPDNWVETGWYITASGYTRYFIAWSVSGQYEEQLLGYAPPATYHWFAARNPTGNEWEFWLDNTQWLLTLDDMPFNVGRPGAQSEVHNSCDQAGTTFWYLQKYIRTYQGWYPWTSFAANIDNPSNNPNYYIDRSGQWGAPDVLRISPY